MPPCACSNAPSRSRSAPVNAPRTWPNSSDSMSVRGTPAQSHTTNGPLARAAAPRGCASAHSSLPVPVSPSMSTATSDCGDALEHGEHLAHLSDAAEQLAEAIAARRRQRSRALGRGQLRARCRRRVMTAPAPTVTSSKRAPSYEAAVGRAEVADAGRPPSVTCELEVLARHRAVGRREVAAGRLADEVGAALEQRAPCPVGAGQDQQAQAARDRRPVCPPGRRCPYAGPGRYPIRRRTLRYVST